jgi:hypothetical protein
MPESELADQLQGMADSAVADHRINDDDLVRTLRFIGSVVTVVGQAFDEVLATLIELSYVTPDHLQEPRKSELLADLDRVVERSHYKDVLEICSRLKHLSDHYAQVIRPKLGGLADESAWSEVFSLLEEHEGAIMRMVERRVQTLHKQLETARDGDLPQIRQHAVDARKEIEQMLERLWDLRNQILGLSGSAGWLELIETGRRSEAEAETTPRK